MFAIYVLFNLLTVNQIVFINFASDVVQHFHREDLLDGCNLRDVADAFVARLIFYD